MEEQPIAFVVWQQMGQQPVEEGARGAAQYVMQTKPRETIVDPVRGTGAFLLAAYEYVVNNDLARDHLKHLAMTRSAAWSSRTRWRRYDWGYSV